jgi:hypothetical protein
MYVIMGGTGHVGSETQNRIEARITLTGATERRQVFFYRANGPAYGILCQS